MLLIRIGDFARLAQVSPRALRLYDRLGLLAPHFVDAITGYRYYSLDQLARLNRIVALKDLGFSLTQVARAIHHDLPASELRSMLKAKQVELEQQARETQARLARLAARLSQLELEETMPDYAITLKQIKPHAEGADCPVCQDLKAMGGAGRTDADVLRSMDELASEPGQGLWLRRLDGADAAFPGEPLPEVLPPEAGTLFVRNTSPQVQPQGDVVTLPFVEAHTLPGVELAATTLQTGSQASILLALRALADWINANGYQVAGHYQAHALAEQGNVELAIPVLKTV